MKEPLSSKVVGCAGGWGGDFQPVGAGMARASVAAGCQGAQSAGGGRGRGEGGAPLRKIKLCTKPCSSAVSKELNSFSLIGLLSVQLCVIFYLRSH